jgi:hypothetical protein
MSSEGIGYDIYQYLYNGLVPFKEVSEECLFLGQKKSSSREKISIHGYVMISQLLRFVKRLSLRIRHGKKEFLR